MKTIRIGTRKSQLALWQAEYVRQQLLTYHSDIQVELVEIVSQGDKTLDIPLAQVGGKGLFLKELEVALGNGEIDLAVHSMKDVTVELPEGLHIPVYCPGEDPRDAFVSNNFEGLEDLPEGAVVGTCSLRRQCQIKAKFPHLVMKNLRGNVNTRLAKLDAGEFDGIILAVAGLKRLDMQDRIAQSISTSICLPAVGQGVVGIECRIDDQDINQRIMPLNDMRSTTRVVTERATNQQLGGGCHVPVALYCEQSDETLTMHGLVGKVDGSVILTSSQQGSIDYPVELGKAVAQDLIDQGAREILDAVYQDAGR